MHKPLSMLAVAVTALLQFVLFPYIASADQWTPTISTSESTSGVLINDQYSVGGLASYVASVSGSGNDSTSLLCTSDTESPCSTSANMIGNSLLPVCKSDIDTNCVASMSLGSSEATLQQSTFERMAAGPSTPGDPSTGLFPGSTVGFWTNKYLSAEGSSSYMTNVNLAMSFNSETKKWAVRTFLAKIVPFTTKSGVYNQFEFRNMSQPNGRTRVSMLGQTAVCAWQEQGVCDVAQDFPAGTVASMTLRISKNIGGWFRGRLQKPNINVSTFNESSNLITVTAETVSVPQLAVTYASNSQDPGVAKLCILNQFACAPRSYANLSSDDKTSFTAIDDLRSITKNSSSGSISMWSFSSYQALGNACLTNTSSVLGLVTTNAMAYDGSVPSFANGFLTYNVAGMHYMPDGVTPVQGTYDMVMADSVARCLYGFSNAPISGTISVSEDNGVQNVATTTVSDIGGWVHLAAYGFNFSNPVITAKLTQAAPVVAPPVIIAAPAKKTTITCVNTKNKKLIKKITAVKPVCPSGYKKV